MCFRPPTIDLDDMKCSECGADIPAGEKTCPKCGAVQAVFAEVAPPPVPKSGVSSPRVPGVPKPPEPGK